MLIVNNTKLGLEFKIFYLTPVLTIEALCKGGPQIN